MQSSTIQPESLEHLERHQSQFAACNVAQQDRRYALDSESQRSGAALLRAVLRATNRTTLTLAPMGLWICSRSSRGIAIQFRNAGALVHWFRRRSRGGMR